MLSQESKRVFQNLLLFCFITNHLIAGPLGNSEFCFPRISMFPSTSPRETLRFSGNNSLFRSRPVIKCLLCSWAILSKLNVVVLRQTGHFFDKNN